MKKLQMNKENRILIESVIRENPNFSGNEELIDVFCEVIYKKSYLLIDAIKDKQRLKRHLTSICETSMNQIIREKQKLNISKEQTQNSKIVSVKKPKPQKKEDKTALNKIKREIVSLKEEIQTREKFDATEELIDPLEYCPQKEASEATVEKLIEIVQQVHAQNPKKKYYDIFFLRYIKGCSQTEIARDLKISQVELSKRFVEMIKLAGEKV